MLGTIVRSIAVDGIKESAASFRNKQTDVDHKQERLNELLIQINSAIEFAKAREPIQNIWLRKWLEDLRKAARDGEEVQSAFEEQTVTRNTTMNPLKVTKRLYQKSKNVNRLNDSVTRLERKASGCKEFLRRLRYEFKEQQHQTCITRMGKLEKKVRHLRNCLRSLKSDSKFKNHKKTKLRHQLRRADTTFAKFPQLPELHNLSHDKTDNIIDVRPIYITKIYAVFSQKLTVMQVSFKILKNIEFVGSFLQTDHLNPLLHQLDQSDLSHSLIRLLPQEDVSTEPANTTLKFGEWEGDHHYTSGFNQCRAGRQSESATNDLKPLPTVHANASNSGNNKHKVRI